MFIIENNNFIKLGEKCIEHSNYEILGFLEKEGMEINDSLIKKAESVDNLFLVKYFHKIKPLPKDIIFPPIIFK